MEVPEIIKALRMCCDAGVEQTPELLCEAADALEQLNGATPKNKPLEMSPKHKAALTELVEMMNEDENNPLTLEELRNVDKEKVPVWIAEKGSPNHGEYWQYAYDFNSDIMAFFTFGNECEEFYSAKNYGKTWLAYARKPERSEI